MQLALSFDNEICAGEPRLSALSFNLPLASFFYVRAHMRSLLVSLFENRLADLKIGIDANT